MINSTLEVKNYTDDISVFSDNDLESLSPIFDRRDRGIDLCHLQERISDFFQSQFIAEKTCITITCTNSCPNCQYILLEEDLLQRWLSVATRDDIEVVTKGDLKSYGFDIYSMHLLTCPS